MGTRIGRGALKVVAANIAITIGLLAVIELTSRVAEYVVDRQQLKNGQLPQKHDSELRVFVFGGSSVYGMPVPEVAFVAQMQYWLKRLYPERNIRIYNFGMPGANTRYALQEFHRRLADQPDLMIVITGHNEFLAPFSSERATSVDEKLARYFSTVRLVDRALAHMMRYRKGAVTPDHVEPRDRLSVAFRNRVAVFEQSIRDMVSQARQHNVKLIVATLPSNMADWPPIHRKLPGRDQHYSDLVSRIQDCLRKGEYREASAAISSGFQLYVDDAMLHFLSGKLQAMTGEYSAAREAFLKARDLDPVPVRTTSQLNSIIRQAASGVSGVYMLDLERVYEERAKNGLVGFDLFWDNAHGTPLGESISAQALIEEMAQIKFLPPLDTSRDRCCPAGPFLADIGYLKQKSPLHFHSLMQSAKYAMKTPFLNYDISRGFLLDAMQVDRDSWQVWANLGTLSYLTGDAATGAKELQRATQLHHGGLDVNDRADTPYLKEALQFAATGQTQDVPCLFPSCK